MKAGLGLLLGMMATLPMGDQPVVVPSHKIETKKEKQQLSRRQLQQMKGKKTRKNRGKNRYKVTK